MVSARQLHYTAFFFFRGNVLSFTVFEEQCLKPLESVSTKHPQKGITDQIFIMLTDALCSLMCTPYSIIFLSQRAHKDYCNLHLPGNTRGRYFCMSSYDCLTCLLGYLLLFPICFIILMIMQLYKRTQHDDLLLVCPMLSKITPVPTLL